LDDLVRFYHAGLGLELLYRFEGHDGYTGAILGLPGADYQLEFTTREEASPGDAPTRDNLLVFYLGSAGEVATVVAGLATLGHHPVEAENPFWPANGGVTIEDPDGWRIVLMPEPVF
jgi:catechol 2,3-dioxygenase-like lactoylglutathione lyase family enzyme